MWNRDAQNGHGWRIVIVFLVVGCTVFSLFAAVPIHSIILLGELKKSDTGVEIPEESFPSIAERIKRLDVNHEIKRRADFEELVGFYSTYTADHEIAEVIIDEALRNEIPLNLAFALAWRESQYNPWAVSRPNRSGTRDWGLFQLNDGHRRHWTRKDFFDVRKNTRTGLSFLRYCIDEMGSIRGGLAAYNAGVGGVRIYGVPASTKLYIKAIFSYEKKLDLAFTLHTLKNRYSESL